MIQNKEANKSRNIGQDKNRLPNDARTTGSPTLGGDISVATGPSLNPITHVSNRSLLDLRDGLRDDVRSPRRRRRRHRNHDDRGLSHRSTGRHVDGEILHGGASSQGGRRRGRSGRTAGQINGHGIIRHRHLGKSTSATRKNSKRLRLTNQGQGTVASGRRIITTNHPRRSHREDRSTGISAAQVKVEAVLGVGQLFGQLKAR